MAVRLIDNVVSGMDRPPGELLTESSESKRAKRKPEIAQRNVEVPWNQQEIYDDAEEPCRHDVSAIRGRAATSTAAAISTSPTKSMKV